MDLSLWKSERGERLKRRMKRWIGGLLACFFGFMSLPVMAAPVTESVIDTSLKGSLTIVKYENQRVEAEDIDAGIGMQEGTILNQHVPVADVTYTIYRIADITQGHLDQTHQSVSIEYRSLIQDDTSAHRTIPIPSGLKSAEEWNTFIEDLRDSADPSKRIGNLKELDYRTGKTNEDGVLVFEDLPLGVWVAYEESYPALITEPHSFVVSIPSTAVNDGNEGDTQTGDDVEGDNMAGDLEREGMYWDYDLIARPKNTVKEISVEKHIVADDGESTTAEEQASGSDDPTNDHLTDTEDYEIGDVIRYSVQAEIPVNIGEMQYFYLVDRLSEGQTFVNDTAVGNRVANLQVWGEPLEGGEPVFIPRKNGSIENWRVSDPTKPAQYEDITEDRCTEFHIYFNTQSLSEQATNSHLNSTKRIPLYRKIWVTFNVTLNENAIIGNPGNPNDIALYISHTTTSNAEEIPSQPGIPEEGDEIDIINPQCPDTRVYTYQVEITKKGEGIEDMSGVEFELRDSSGQRVAVSQDETGYYVDRDSTEKTVIQIDEDQKIQIRGLDAAMYQIVENKTLPGYNLLREPIIITLTSEAADPNKTFQYTEDPSGDYFQIEEGRGYYIEQNNKKLLINLEGHKVGDYVKVAGTVFSFDMEKDDGTMQTDVQEVSHRYRFRITDDEKMTWNANYPMENGMIVLTVLNRKGFEVPSTGGVGVWPFVLGGTGLVLSGIWLFWHTRKRRV